MPCPVNSINFLLECSQVHHQWRDILSAALAQVNADYLDNLTNDQDWLPGANNLLRAFRRDLTGVRYLLVGESPYPRRESANGIAFYDAAVGALWSDSGLSRPVNRATSMRNILKAMLLAEGRLAKDHLGKVSQYAISQVNKNNMIRTMPEFFSHLERAGFLMLNATPVLHPRRKPSIEAVYWRGFLEFLFKSLATHSSQQVTLLLWGKIAANLLPLTAGSNYHKLVCEHPYNLSFIDNADIQHLFSSLDILQV